MARSGGGTGTGRRGTGGVAAPTQRGVEAGPSIDSAREGRPVSGSGPSSGALGTNASCSSGVAEEPRRRCLRPRPGAKVDTVVAQPAQGVRTSSQAAPQQRKARRRAPKDDEAVGEAHPATRDVVILSDDEEETGEAATRGIADEVENAREGQRTRQRQQQPKRGSKRQRGTLTDVTNVPQALHAGTASEDVLGRADATGKPWKAAKNDGSGRVASPQRDTPRDAPQPSSYAGSGAGNAVHTGRADTRNVGLTEATAAKDCEGQAPWTGAGGAQGQQLPGSANASCIIDPHEAKAAGSVGVAGRRDSRESKRGTAEGVAAALGFESGDPGMRNITSNASSRKAPEAPGRAQADAALEDDAMEGAGGAGITTTLKPPTVAPAQGRLGPTGAGVDLSLALGRGVGVGDAGEGEWAEVGEGEGEREALEGWEMEVEDEEVDEEGEEDEGLEDEDEGGDREGSDDHAHVHPGAGPTEPQGAATATAAVSAPLIAPTLATASAATVAASCAPPAAASHAGRRQSTGATIPSTTRGAASGAQRRHSTGTALPSAGAGATDASLAPSSERPSGRNQSLRRLRSSDPGAHQRQRSGTQGARGSQGRRPQGAAQTQAQAGPRNQRQVAAASAAAPALAASDGQVAGASSGSDAAASRRRTATTVCTATGRIIPRTRDAPSTASGNPAPTAAGAVAGVVTTGGAGAHNGLSLSSQRPSRALGRGSGPAAGIGGGTSEEGEGAGSSGRGLRRGPLQLGVISIDSFSSDPQACTTYAVDIYRHLRLAELRRRPSPSCLNDQQQEITPAMRAILVDWLVEVAEQYRLVPDTLYLTINYIDRYLSIQPVTRARLQLLGVSCMLIASKYEEIYAPQVDEFCYITDNTYRREEVLEMEHTVLNALHFQLSVPTVKTFLRRFNRAAQADLAAPSLELEFLGNFLAELTLVDYASLCYIPSLIAASAVAVARGTLWPDRQAWTPTLEFYSGYTARQLQECACHILSLQRSGSNTLPAIREKYRHVQFQMVAMLQPVTEAELMAKLNVAATQ